MCRRVECSKCGRPTYAGCGAHVEQVLRDVPPSQRCQGAQGKGGRDGASAASGPPSGLRKLFAKLR